MSIPAIFLAPFLWLQLETLHCRSLMAIGNTTHEDLWPNTKTKNDYIHFDEQDIHSLSVNYMIRIKRG